MVQEGSCTMEIQHLPGNTSPQVYKMNFHGISGICNYQKHFLPTQQLHNRIACQMYMLQECSVIGCLYGCNSCRSHEQMGMYEYVYHQVLPDHHQRTGKILGYSEFEMGWCHKLLPGTRSETGLLLARSNMLVGTRKTLCQHC
jgi:hypothetical protein